MGHARKPKTSPASLVAPVELISAVDMAALLHKSPGTLANWRANRKGPPFIRIGSTPWYPRTTSCRWKTNLPREAGTHW